MWRRKRHIKGQKDAHNTPAVWVSPIWQLSLRLVALTNMYPATAGVHVHNTDHQNLPVGRSCSKQTTHTVVRIYCVQLAVQNVCLPLMAVRVIANTSGDPCIDGFLFLNTSFFNLEIQKLFLNATYLHSHATSGPAPKCHPRHQS